MLENRMLIDEYFISDTKIKDEDYYNNMPDYFEEIKDMNNEELFRRYTELRIEIDNKYSEKKQLEKELQDRFRAGKFGGN